LDDANVAAEYIFDQIRALPLAKKTASLIEKETLALCY